MLEAGLAPRLRAGNGLGVVERRSADTIFTIAINHGEHDVTTSRRHDRRGVGHRSGTRRGLDLAQAGRRARFLTRDVDHSPGDLANAAGWSALGAQGGRRPHRIDEACPRLDRPRHRSAELDPPTVVPSSSTQRARPIGSRRADRGGRIAAGGSRPADRGGRIGGSGADRPREALRQQHRSPGVGRRINDLLFIGGQRCALRDPPRRWHPPAGPQRETGALRLLPAGGISPDGATLAYTGAEERNGRTFAQGLCTIPATGGDDVLISTWDEDSVGCEYSSDGQCLVSLSFPPGTGGHEANVPVIIRSMRHDGTDRHDVSHAFGG